MILRRILRIPGFVVWFIGQMFAANWEVAKDVLTPGSDLRSGILGYTAASRSSWEVMLFSNLIALTPGTLTIDVDISETGECTLYILNLYAPEQQETMRNELIDLEKRMLKVVRG